MPLKNKGNIYNSFSPEQRLLLCLELASRERILVIRSRENTVYRIRELEGKSQLVFERIYPSLRKIFLVQYEANNQGGWNKSTLYYLDGFPQEKENLRFDVLYARALLIPCIARHAHLNNQVPHRLEGISPRNLNDPPYKMPNLGYCRSKLIPELNGTDYFTKESYKLYKKHCSNCFFNPEQTIKEKEKVVIDDRLCYINS